MEDVDRRKVFWLLKKYTSYTVWQALAKAYGIFVDEWLVAMRKARASDIDEFNRNATKIILEGRVELEKGLKLLRCGDRTVWRMSDDKSYAAWGNFAKACDVFNFVYRIMDPEEYVFDWMRNKQAVFDAFNTLEFWTAGSGAANERPSALDAAPFNPSNVLATVHPVYGVPLRDPAYLNFPVNLPAVPEPQETVVVSGGFVPWDGIYEPEWSDSKGGVPSVGFFEKALSLRETAPAAPGPALQRAGHIGCMNYLLAHTAAPVYCDQDSDPPMSVIWRLIWKDERYLDGKIPEEEAEYLRPIEAPPMEATRCDAGQPCPRTGYWFTPAQSGSRRHFQAGEIMPAFQSSWGVTIWQWDADQEP